jgi:hypothetical protein
VSDSIVTRAAHKWLRVRGFHVWKWPERKPNERAAIRVLAGRCSMDSPAHSHGVRINAEQNNGWLRVQIETDDSIKGWTLSYNGRDVPIYVEKHDG